MSIKVVLFDLDGTLLPMNQDAFVKDYLGRMAKKLAPHGYEPNQLVKAIYAGMGAMIGNDGSCTNEEAFWKTFAGILGDHVKEDLPIFDDYYKNEFQEVRHSCGFLPEAAKTVRAIRDKGYRVVLATNPMFPSIATESRMRWAGLEPEDFELYTTYENSTYCKPNLKYYEEIIEKLGVSPKECLMVGNDVGEDMITEKLGMKVFLLPADLINKEGKDISVYPQGDLADLMEYMEILGNDKVLR
ncbi:MAG: HAD family hydrolase [Lachnospiraceae bacterium]|nr:HAD family hydrolase [Lachnospiraceae bacterium]